MAKPLKSTFKSSVSVFGLLCSGIASNTTVSDGVVVFPRLKQPASSRELLEHFERNMGCIEILGMSGRIERVYFEVKDTRLRQWEETQIKASRRSFLHSVEMGSQKNKLKGFMSFCDETIFEVNFKIPYSIFVCWTLL